MGVSVVLWHFISIKRVKQSKIGYLAYISYNYVLHFRRRLLDLLVPRTADQSGIDPAEKINAIPPIYFVLCRQAVSKYTKPTMNLPWMTIKLQNYKNINTRAIQHYNSKVIQCC